MYCRPRVEWKRPLKLQPARVVPSYSTKGRAHAERLRRRRGSAVLSRKQMLRCMPVSIPVYWTRIGHGHGDDLKALDLLAFLNNQSALKGGQSFARSSLFRPREGGTQPV